MTDNGREALRIPIHDTKPSHHPVLDSHPVIGAESKNPFELILHIRDSKSGKRARPKHTNGAVLFWSVNETAITNPVDLKTSLLITRIPHLMVGPWQNGLGENDPWSEVVSAVIP